MLEAQNYQRKEAHHVKPISLLGANKSYNILELNSKVHADLHKTLDLAPHILGKLTRKWRENTNHKIILGEDDMQFMGDIQDMFFDRLHHLPINLQKEHVRKLIEEFEYHNGVYQKLTGDKLDNPKVIINPKEQFFELHHASIEAQKEIAKIISLAVKKNFNL